MIKIRLTRQGSGLNKFFRIIAIDESKKRSGEALESIGYWQPSKNLKQIDTKKIAVWVAKGAKLTKAVEKLILPAKK
jgi:small subunit ribosomal protein S16